MHLDLGCRHEVGGARDPAEDVEVGRGQRPVGERASQLQIRAALAALTMCDPLGGIGGASSSVGMWSRQMSRSRRSCSMDDASMWRSIRVYRRAGPRPPRTRERRVGMRPGFRLQQATAIAPLQAASSAATPPSPKRRPSTPTGLCRSGHEEAAGSASRTGPSLSLISCPASTSTTLIETGIGSSSRRSPAGTMRSTSLAWTQANGAALRRGRARGRAGAGPGPPPPTRARRRPWRRRRCWCRRGGSRRDASGRARRPGRPPQPAAPRRHRRRRSPRPWTAISPGRASGGRRSPSRSDRGGRPRTARGQWPARSAMGRRHVARA